MGTPTVGIPHAYRDWVEGEHKRLGSESKIQTMKHILDVYFGAVDPNRAPNASAGPQTDGASEVVSSPATGADAKPNEPWEVYVSYVEADP